MFAIDVGNRWRQAPAMVMAFLKPNEDGGPPELGKDARIALQHFPGPLKYPYMHQFLTAFAGMMGCAEPLHARVVSLCCVRMCKQLHQPRCIAPVNELDLVLTSSCWVDAGLLSQGGLQKS